MSDPRSSLEKWRSIANFDRAETDAARAQAAGISTVELAHRDEAEYVASMPAPVRSEAENTSQLAQDMAAQRAELDVSHDLDTDIGDSG